MTRATLSILSDIRERCLSHQIAVNKSRYRSEGAWKINKRTLYASTKRCIMDINAYARDLDAKEKQKIKQINWGLLDKLSNAWSWYDGNEEPHQKCVQYLKIHEEILEALDHM